MADLSEIVTKSLAAGVEKIITISVSKDNLQTVRELTRFNPAIFCSQGIHPHQASEWSEQVAEEVYKQAQNPSAHKMVAIGEIGLDFHYNRSPKEKQREAFKAQLKIAAQYDLPVIIHSREADEDTENFLQEFAPRLQRKGVIHSFTSGEKLAHQALKLGFYLGFNGIITFKNAVNVQEIVKLCPLDRILLETDSPYLTPVPFRGKENAPYHLPLVAEKIAALKGVAVQEVWQQTTENAKNLFQFD